MYFNITAIHFLLTGEAAIIGLLLYLDWINKKRINDLKKLIITNDTEVARRFGVITTNCANIIKFINDK